MLIIPRLSVVNLICTRLLRVLIGPRATHTQAMQNTLFDHDVNLCHWKRSYKPILSFSMAISILRT